MTKKELEGEQDLLRLKLKEAAIEFLEAHSGAVLILQSSGGRGNIPNMEALFVPSAGSVWGRQADGNCCLASFCNALDIVVGRKEATLHVKYCETAGVVAEKASAIPLAFMAAKVPAETRKLPPKMRGDFAQRRFELLGAVGKGFFVVCLDGSCSHCVVVDGCHRVIICSMDQCPLCPTAETLNKCGGGNERTKMNLSARQI